MEDCDDNFQEDFIDYCEFIESHSDEQLRLLDEKEDVSEYKNRKCEICGSKVFICNNSNNGKNDIIYACGKEEIGNNGIYNTVRKCLK